MKKRSVIILSGLVIFIYFLISQSRFYITSSYVREDVGEVITVDVTLEGIIKIIHYDDFEGRKSWSDYILESDKKEYDLKFVNEIPDVLTGARISATGKLMNNQLYVSSYEILSNIFPISTPPIIRKIGVILFNFQNNPSQPYSPPTVQSVVFTASNSVKYYYLENSYNQLILEGKYSPNGEIYGWFTIPYDNTNCIFSTWSNAAYNMAVAAGYDLTGYDSLVYIFPYTSSCGFGGVAVVGGNIVWSNGLSNYVVSHELGHNLGSQHANAYLCTENGQPVAISEDCNNVEYGDPFDVMGLNYRHMNNAHKFFLNWLQPSNIITVTTNGVYSIAPIEQSSSSVQAIRIPKDIGNNNQIQKYYYLEFRRPFGLFDSFPLTDPVVNGVTIRIARPNAAETHLIDNTPTLTPSPYDSSLLAGNTFFDQIKGIRIKTLSISPSFAYVNITFVNASLCVHANPSMSVLPLVQYGSPGNALNYTVTVMNNDNANCGITIFDISPSLPYPWNQIPLVFQISVAPGSTASRIFSVISGPASSFGNYIFSESAVSTVSSSYGATASANYYVRPPVAASP